MYKGLLSFLFPFLFIIIFYTDAQSNSDAQKIVGNMMADVKTTAFKTDFKLIINSKGALPQLTSGTFTMKGNKFVLDMAMVKVYFNGMTQWSYVASTNEVSISTPSEKELAETNPMALLVAYYLKSKISFATETKSSKNHCIDLTPEARDKDVSKINIQVDKKNGDLKVIKLYYKNGFTYTSSLHNFKKGIVVPDSYFTFDKTKFKGVTVNDLR
jgi:outer membrane lipoprotein carrier protein